MAKLGVITDGISTDFEHALKVMSDNGLDQAELQYLWDKEVGDMSVSYTHLTLPTIYSV